MPDREGPKSEVVPSTNSSCATPVESCSGVTTWDTAAVFASLKSIIKEPSRKAVMYSCQMVRCTRAKAMGLLARLIARTVSQNIINSIEFQHYTVNTANVHKN